MSDAAATKGSTAAWGWQRLNKCEPRQARVDEQNYRLRVTGSVQSLEQFGATSIKAQFVAEACNIDSFDRAPPPKCRQSRSRRAPYPQSSLLSVIIGLNLAYYAFREIRGPHVDRLRENLDKTGVQALNSISEARILRESIRISERTEVTSLFFEFVKLHKLATELSRSANNIIGNASSIAVERRLGLPAMLVAIAAILLLIVSTFRYDARISDFMVYAMIVVGFLPHHCRNCDKLRGPREYKHV